MNDAWERLKDILQATDDAELLVARGKTAFDGDPLLIRSAKNIVTEIGEAAKNLGDLADGMPEVPWRSPAGMRDRTIHRYPEVDLDILWDTISVDLPELDRAVRKFMDERKQADGPGESLSEGHTATSRDP